MSPPIPARANCSSPRFGNYRFPAPLTNQHIFRAARLNILLHAILLQVKANGMNELTLRDGRYDGIFHLVTAAAGAEEHYSLDNNEARSEPVQLAREVLLGGCRTIR